ncbi:MAG TPA: type II CAAX endopeptidase family protein [Rhodanobacteraceae bacterium]|nr:type II CAAX endopeptidase family protein [Rhodanobacteraceae bacterium]
MANRHSRKPLIPPFSVAFQTPPAAPHWQRWLLFSPLARLLIFVLLALGLMLAGYAVADALGWQGDDDTALPAAATGLLTEAIPWLLAYLILVCWVERRPVSELAWRTLLPHTLLGLLLGAALFSTVIGILGALGVYHITGTRAEMHWLAAVLSLGVVPAIGEEIVSRGVLFRIVEEGLGTWVALVVSALFFGLAHLGNPNATLWSALAIAIEAGLLFGLIFHVTRSLYLCMGLHAAWNILQGAVFGAPVSGLPAQGKLIATLTGPDWLSGGAFGPEASPIAMVCCLAVALPFLLAMRRRGSAVPPYWRRGGSLGADRDTGPTAAHSD